MIYVSKKKYPPRHLFLPLLLRISASNSQANERFSFYPFNFENFPVPPPNPSLPIHTGMPNIRKTLNSVTALHCVIRVLKVSFKHGSRIVYFKQYGFEQLNLHTRNYSKIRT